MKNGELSAEAAEAAVPAFPDLPATAEDENKTEKPDRTETGSGENDEVNTSVTKNSKKPEKKK